MYNLDFAVTAAKTTKGVNMRILNSRDKLMSFALLDTEGMRALENVNENPAQLRKNDNRLSAFVLGIADICLINMEKFDHSHLKEILKMVCKSFLKFDSQGRKDLLQQVYFKPARCLFVHQKISNMRNEDINPQRQTLLTELNECAEIASKMIKKGKMKIDYND